MPRKSVHGVRSEFAVLELFEKNKTLAPDDINNFMNNGNYASKYICYLRIAGYDFDVNKDGRRVVSYTLKGKIPTKSKKAAGPSPTASKTHQKKQAKPTKMPVKKPVMSIEEKLLQDLDLFPKNDHSLSSYSIDSEWDSTENLDIATLLR